MGAKRNVPKQAYESRHPDATKERFTAIYDSMMDSAAFQDLSSGAVRLYLYMKRQLYGQAQIDGKSPEYFYFNRHIWKEKLQLYTNESQFYKDSQALILHGLIEIEENGRFTRTRSIYRLSDKWQQWRPGDDYRPIAMQKKEADKAARKQAKAAARAAGQAVAV